ncbi:MAG: helix-turn-helix domain-containing protein [Bacteroidales bacterium]
MTKHNELPELENRQALGQREVLTLKEAARYMGLAVGTLYRLTCKKRITHFKPGGKIIYLKLSDIQEYMLRNRIATADDLDAAAGAYLVKHPKK